MADPPSRSTRSRTTNNLVVPVYGAPPPPPDPPDYSFGTPDFLAALRDMQRLAVTANDHRTVVEFIRAPSQDAYEAFLQTPRSYAVEVVSLDGEVIELRRSTDGATVGRTVHYVNLGDRDGRYPPAVIPSLVTRVNDDGTVALKHFYPTGVFDTPSVPFSPTLKRGHWSWPEARTTAR